MTRYPSVTITGAIARVRLVYWAVIERSSTGHSSVGNSDELPATVCIPPAGIGIVSQADVARNPPEDKIGDLVEAISSAPFNS